MSSDEWKSIDDDEIYNPEDHDKDDYLYEMEKDARMFDAEERLRELFTEFMQKCIAETDRNGLLRTYQNKTPDLLRSIDFIAQERLKQVGGLDKL